MKRLLVLLTAVLATTMGLLSQGTTWQNATLVNSSPGSQYFSLLENHWYKIIVPEEGQIYIFVLTNGPWTMRNCVFYRYSENLNTIIQRGTFGCDANAASFSTDDVGPGVYYFYLEGTYPQDNPMNYDMGITYTFTPCPQAADPEPNDDYQHAGMLNGGSTVEGRLGYISTEGITDTEDWYKIVVPEEGQIELIATATGSVRFYPYYSTVNGYKNDNIYSRGSFTGNTSSASQTDTMSFKATDVGAGTYYIRINRYPSSGKSGGYYLSYKFTPCPQAADPEPNNDYERSSLLGSGKTVEGRLGYRTSDDVTDTDDWYKIVVPEEGQIELMATATGSARFYPYYCTVNGYKNDNIYRRGSFTGNNGNSASDTITFKATDVGKGTYYIRINRYTGSGGYCLSYRFTPCPQAADPEPNNEYQRYCRLLNGKTTEGRMGYRTSDDVTDTDDWYRIIVPKDGPVDITVTATETLKFYPYESKICSIQDNNLYNVASFTGNNSSSNSDTITYQNNNMAAGTYYIKIHRYSGSGGYRILYNGPISDIPGDVDGDGLVTIADVTGLIDILLKGDGSSTPGNADVDGDGRITIGDVTALIDQILGS